MTATAEATREQAASRLPDLEDARRFLELLDPGADEATFQVFDDGPARDPRKARIYHGTLDAHAKRLASAQAAGCGVFVTINATDGRGRKAENITRVRAAFSDLDGAPLEPVRTCALEPHIIVEPSPGRYHAYWLVDGLPLDSFKEMQKAIAARFGGDPDVHDLPRVLRLPGFYHLKDAARPFRSRIIHVAEATPYGADRVLAAFPPGNGSAGDGHDGAGSPWAEKALHDEAEAVRGAREGDRNKTLNRSAFNLGQVIGGGGLDRARVEPELTAAALAAGLAAPEIARTIKSGIDAGMREPRTAPESGFTGFGYRDGIFTGGPSDGAAGEAPPVGDTWPAPLDSVAFHGLAGDVVRAIEPHSEADPAALLIQFLAAFGNAIGRGPYFAVESDRHATNLFVLLAGRTAKGRKGTSWGHIHRLMELVDPDWTRERIAAGMSSGEGLIWEVRDAIEKPQPVKEKGKATRYETAVVDPGIEDKRVLIVESEFASTLRVMAREGNTLSAIIRQAWDKGDQRTMTKNSPARATGALVSIVAHCTADELRRYLDRTELANGFANRFLITCTRRSKLLPEGGCLDEAVLQALAARLRDALDYARSVGAMCRDEDARTIWREVYPVLSEGRPGLLGFVVSRAEAQVIRVALLYALLDRASEIQAAHLTAALALWQYSEASAGYIFGDALGDPVADEILKALRASADGLTRTEIFNLFARHQERNRISRALGDLMAAGAARMTAEPTGGRPTERWRAAQ